MRVVGIDDRYRFARDLGKFERLSEIDGLSWRAFGRMWIRPNPECVCGQGLPGGFFHEQSVDAALWFFVPYSRELTQSVPELLGGQSAHGRAAEDEIGVRFFRQIDGRKLVSLGSL